MLWKLKTKSHLSGVKRRAGLHRCAFCWQCSSCSFTTTSRRKASPKYFRILACRRRSVKMRLENGRSCSFRTESRGAPCRCSFCSRHILRHEKTIRILSCCAKRRSRSRCRSCCGQDCTCLFTAESNCSSCGLRRSSF